MVDSTGAPTTGTIATNFSEGRYDGTAPGLTMLRATLTDFAKGVASRTVTIRGLEAGGRYDVWIVSHRHQGGAAERQYGSWSTAHDTISPSPQIANGTSGTLNGSTFVAGVNFLQFENVEAGETGQIVFNGRAARFADGFDADYRLHFNGLQIAPAGPVVPPEPLEFTEIVRDPETGEVTLTWKSNPGERYGLYWTPDLKDFTMHGVHHAIPANANGNRTTLGPMASPLPDADKLFFLVGPPDLSNPSMSKAFGSGGAVTLVFSEPIRPDSAGDPGNFSVTLNGTSIAVLAASLDASGRNIILTLGGSLQAGASYQVVAENITTLAGRVIPASFNVSFQTWDENPNGVQVFILAGQSNMVGHGKADQGHQDVQGAIGSLRYEAVNDTANYGHLLVDSSQPATSAWKTRDDVKVWWRDSEIDAPRGVIKGDLRIGYSQGRNPGWFGPDYGFGWKLGDHFTDKPVLILKIAWGGKSLNADFRPPSAAAARGGVVGPYYTAMIEYARDCLSKLGTEFPEFDGMGYRIAGFGWHQGWNDRVDAAATAAYQVNLVDLINDLRAEFGNPALPFSINTTGMATSPAYSGVELAQLAVADAGALDGKNGGLGFAGAWQDLTSGSNNGEGFIFGRSGNTNGTNDITYNAGAFATRTNVSNLSASQDHLLVLKFEFGDAGDTVSTWYFPENTTPTEADFNTNARSTTSNFNIDENTLTTLAVGFTRAANAFDEIRIGDTFTDIISLPPAGAMDVVGSSVAASPSAVVADGSKTSSITVTLTDSLGVPVSCKDVTLANTAGPQAAVIDPLTAVTTDANGRATFTVRSGTPGIEEFTATNTTDSRVVTQTATVPFVGAAEAGLSTVAASPLFVPADGTSTSTITVTVLGLGNSPLAGKNVTLANTSGPQAAVVNPLTAVTTDANGQASFTVSSSTQ